MPRYQIKQNYIEHLGVNLKLDELNSNSVYAESAKNTLLGEKGELRPRPGYKKHLEGSNDSVGVFNHKGINGVEGEKEEIFLITASSGNPDSISKAERDFITAHYTGVGEGSVQITFNGTAFVVTLYVDGAVDATHTIGGSDTNLTIRNFINAESGWASTDGTLSNNARGFEITPLLSAEEEVKLYYWAPGTVTNASGTTLPETDASAIDHKPLSSTTINGATYVAMSDNRVWKYTNGDFYRGGLWTAGGGMVSDNLAGGSLTASDTIAFAWRARMTDPAGNVTYGPINYDKQLIAGGDIDAYANLTYIANYGNTINTQNATASSGVVTCTSSAEASKFYVGDYVSMGQTSSGRDSLVGEGYVTDVSGAVVTTNGSFSSAGGDLTKGMVVELYRAIGDYPSGTIVPGPYYFVNESPMPYNSTVNVRGGNVSDETLSTRATLDPKQWTFGLPMGSIVASYQRQLVISGDPELPGQVWFADLVGQEQFDPARSFFLVDGVVTALGPTREQLIIFKERNSDIVTGDLFSYSFRVDQADGDIGCVSRTSVQIMGDGLLFFLSHKGPYKAANGFISPLGEHVSRSGERSSILEPFFNVINERDRYTGPSSAIGSYYAFHKSTSARWQFKNLYILHIPAESKADPGVEPADLKSKTWVFDYDRGTWHDWEDIRAFAGLVPVGDSIMFYERVSGGGDVHRFNNTSTQYDQFDADAAISCEYKPLWENFGEPSALKKVTRLKVYTRGATANANYTMDFTSQHDFDSGTSYLNLTDLIVPKDSSVKIKLKGKMRQWRPVFSHNTVNEDWAISGWDVEVAAPYRKAIK